MASKRRTLLYTLPILVGVGFLAGAGLAAWYRADTISKLSEEIAHGEKSNASTAVLQLAAISNPPLPLLVEAAACDATDTVEAAQIAINKLLDDWQHQVDNGERLGRVADQVSELAEALAEQRRSFPTSNYAWLASVTHKMIRVAEKCPSKTMPLFALHCDEMMSLIANASDVAMTSVPPRPLAVVPPRQIDIGPVNGKTNPTTDSAQLEQTFSSFPTSSPDIGTNQSQLDSDNPRVSDEGRRPHSDGNILRHQPDESDDDSSDAVPGETTSASNGTTGRSSLASPNDRILPKEQDAHGSPGAGADSQGASALGTYSTRELLERWRTAGGDEHRDVERQLASRGFKHLSPALVQQYLSTDDSRSHIVDAVLKLPGPEVRPWLFLLADDEDADVRLLAVTVMATSSDRALIEKAWQISIRDQDPRIADLSAHLRERRAATQLR